MDNVGGGNREPRLWAGNREGLAVPTGATPEAAPNVAPNLEQGPSLEAGPLVNPIGEQMSDPRLANAIGIATVGATGVTPEREAQLVEQITTLPGDNRTAEEIAIDAPEVARDGDQMEKEWMDRARAVVKETKDDPNGRLLKVARLREDYMRKRFNRILGERNDA